MKKNCIIWLSGLCMVLLTVASASASLIAYEGFDMNLAEGEQILGQAGDTSFGFAEPWRTSSTSYNGSFFVVDSLADKTGKLRTRGGSVISREVGGTDLRILRNFSQPLGAVDGTYYMSFLYAASQLTFDLSNGDWNGNRQLTIGREWNSGPVQLVGYGAGFTQDVATQDEVHLFVLKFELAPDADTISLYVDPDPTRPEPTTPVASFTVDNFYADRIRHSCFNTSDEGLLDEIRIGETFADVVPVPGAAFNVSPVDGSAGVPLTTLLEWQVGNDPNEINGIQPWGDVQSFNVYLGTDPNLHLQNAVTLPVTVTTFDPELANDQVYYWQVEEVLADAQGGLYPAGDPNNVLGPVWTFKTPLTTPSIVTEPAAVTRVQVGSDAQIVIEAISTESYQWYYSADNVVGGDTPVGANLPTLTLTNVQLADEGYYYCVASKAGTTPATSSMSQLVINRLLSWYQFENNLSDAAGSADATAVGTVSYADGLVSQDSQAYAFSGDGSGYGELPVGSYPRTGIGNGLERFTYSAWVKLNPGQGGHLLGSFNTGGNTAMRFSVNEGGGIDLSFYMRQEGGSAVVADNNGLGIDDGEWHFVAVTYNGSSVDTFLDGLRISSNGTSISNFAEWEYLPFPILAVNSRGSMDGLFNGTVDDLKIYNYARTREEMAQAYFDVTGEKVCLYGNPTYDLDGNCTVDLADITILAGSWLDSGLYPLD